MHSVASVSQAYTSKRRILIEVLPVPNAYTKSANACIHIKCQIILLFAHTYMHFAWELQLDTQCLYLAYVFRTYCNQNAYIDEQSIKEFGVHIVGGNT